MMLTRNNTWYAFRLCKYAIHVLNMVMFTDMFGHDPDRCTIFEVLFGMCQKGDCQVQSGVPSCVYVFFIIFF